jgi:cell division septum initiation protein DivIVA
MTDRETQRLDELRAEARYHRQRLDLYRARLYGGRALSVVRLEEFQRVSDAAAARLRQATEEASGARPGTERPHTSEPPSA